MPPTSRAFVIFSAETISCKCPRWDQQIRYNNAHLWAWKCEQVPHPCAYSLTSLTWSRLCTCTAPTISISPRASSRVIITNNGNLSGECRKLKFPASFSFTDKRLKGHTIRTGQVPHIDICELLCYQEPNCVSINFKYEVRSVAGGSSYNCELKNSTHLGHDQDFVDAKGYFYRGAEVSSYEVPLQRKKGISAVISMPSQIIKLGYELESENWQRGREVSTTD